VKRNGISVRIRPVTKAGRQYFIADYFLNGRRKLVWRSTEAEARAAASEAIDKISTGETEILELSRQDRDLFIRCRDAHAGCVVPMDSALREYNDAIRLLAGRASIAEAARDWLARHNVPVPRKTVAEACDDCLKAVTTDGKSKDRLKQLSAAFDKFKQDHNMMVTLITTAHVSQWLAGLDLSERTRHNYRSVLGYLCRWCCLRGYLQKGTNWLEGVQEYSATPHGDILIFSPEELVKLMDKAEDAMKPFLAVQAFAGLRHAEAARLDWSEIDLADKFIEVPAFKSKNNQRRLVPIHENLVAWLTPHKKDRGPICEFANTTKQILKIADEAKLTWKHNGLRHSFISYRVAECADVPRVADEAGNSPAMIRQHYLRRVKPALATEWFAIQPKAKS